MADDYGTKHVGVRRAWPGRWETFDRETGAQIGPPHPTRYEASGYARERQPGYEGAQITMGVPAVPPTPEELEALLARISATGYAGEAVALVESWFEERYGVVGTFTAARRAEQIPETELRALHGDR